MSTKQGSGPTWRNEARLHQGSGYRTPAEIDLEFCELKTDVYTDKDGNKHYTLVARIDTVQLIDSKKESEARAARRENSADNAAANSSEEVPF